MSRKSDLVYFHIIRTNGEETYHSVKRSNWFEEMMKLTNCRLHDLVKLPEGKIMLVDDEGLLKQLPLNHTATKVYNLLYNKGSYEVIPIVGDVCIVDRKDLD
jgi:Domain of unknown function (DUF3846)